MSCLKLNDIYEVNIVDGKYVKTNFHESKIFITEFAKVYEVYIDDKLVPLIEENGNYWTCDLKIKKIKRKLKCNDFFNSKLMIILAWIIFFGIIIWFII